FELNNIYYVRCQHITPIPGVDFYAYPALYKINDIDNHPENWELDSSRFIIYSFLFHSDSLDIVTAYDNYLNPNKEYPYIFYLTKKKDSRVNEIEQKSFIYISDPMPNPAENNTQFKVYYPVNLDVNTMQIQVCNILGQVVTNSNAFSVTQINDHIVQINWSIGSFSRGVYLINIKIGNQIGTKAIVIN
ncbi:MAG TPA: T9SS type A sorting domain-containing protein, partial [Bacteroidota bacterium]|nr:T9SS type A sorting domain-containing protein [Bacteroidota bacterium]